MPALKNQMHEQFCQLVASGKTKKQAFLAIRDPSKPPMASDGAARSSATILMNRPDVMGRIAELTEKMVNVKLDATRHLAVHEAITKKWVIDQLIDNVKRAKSKDKIEAATRALELLGKEIGMFVTITKSTVTHVNADDLSDGELADIAATSRLDAIEAPGDPSKLN